MKKFILIILLLLVVILPIQIYAGQVSIGSANLPYTASTAYDTITFNTSRISTSGTGIRVTANNVTIDLRDDTLEFGVGYTDDVYGIYCFEYNHVSNLTILGNPTPNNGGLILHGGGTGSTDSSWRCIDVRIEGQNTNVTITNVDMYITGWDGHNFNHPGDALTNFEISGGRFVDHIVGFTNRCNNTGCSILFGSQTALSTATIHDLTIESWAHGIVANGTLGIYNCSLLIDVKNDLYSYPSEGVCTGSIGAGGIGAEHIGPGTKIHDNVIIAGIENEGSSIGISIEFAVGTEANPIEIYNNYTDLHRGPDDYYGGVTCKGYKQRWSNKHIKVYDNEFHVSAHPDSGAHASAWGINCEGIDLYWINTADGSGGTFRDSFTVIENNRIFAYALDTGCNAVGMRIAVRGESETPPFNWVGAGNIIRNNYYEVAHSAIEFGKSDGGICQGVLIQGDTVALTDSGVVGSPFYPWKSGDLASGSASPYSKNNILRDITYIGSINETNIEWDPANDGDEMFYERTLQVNVRGNNDSLIANATVRVYNYDSTLADTGTTGSYGYLKDTVTYYYAAEAVADTSYSPFNIEVSVGSYTGDSVVTVNWSTGSIEITLDTIGTLPLAGGVDPETNNVLITGGIFRGATIR